MVPGLLLAVASMRPLRRSSRLSRSARRHRSLNPEANVRRLLILCAVAALGQTACGENVDIGLPEHDATSTSEQLLQLARSGQLGHPLPGTNPAAFARATEQFTRSRTIEDGLGPTFNETACANCHQSPVVGGAGSQSVRRFGRVVDGLFFGFDSDEENQGGTVLQAFSNGTYLNGATTCHIPTDVLPAEADVVAARRTPPLFGLGLIDSLPDFHFDAVAASQPTAIRGVVQRVPVTLPDPRSPTQAVGSQRVGRFGWKGLVPSLLMFAADELDIEMGITTQSCFKGTSIKEFSIENHPNNAAPPPGCNGGDLAPPQDPEFVDGAVGDCSGNRTEIQQDVLQLTSFVERLAPPPPRITDLVGFVRGAVPFARLCGDCHDDRARTTVIQPGITIVFFPFSDFLAHDMGTLGDRITQSGQGTSEARLMRTTPLWGARFNTSFLHDGRAHSVREAILLHDGQGAHARDGFLDLHPARQADLLTFVLSL